MAPPAASSSAVDRRHERETQSPASSPNSTNEHHHAPAAKTPNKPPGGASSPEEIERQHQAALQLIESNQLQFSPPDWEGEIPLSAKHCPAVELLLDTDAAGDGDPAAPTSTITHSSLPCWSSRGQVDVSALQQLVQNGYNRRYGPPLSSGAAAAGDSKTDSGNNNSNNHSTTNSSQSTTTATSTTSGINYWDPAYAATHNVAIQRPSHDAWGIPKIVLLFSDDFLHDCYELPFFAAFGRALQPVLNCLNVKKRRVVRALLASLPAGTTIPVHHDTGEWVRHTHRIHVPVLVHDVHKIVFSCGGRAIDCRPGHVFEINNQCRHAVSNCDDDHRVHLILDYVDADYHGLERPKIPLQPSEVLLQTRRSIDRLMDAGRRPTPSFLILGAQKAGTTFLFELVMQHPWIVPPQHHRRETHCLDWRWNDALRTTQQRIEWCRQFYYCDQLHRHPSCQTGDSTPSYLLDSARVIPRLKEVFPHCCSGGGMKFIVTLRDPVRRAESHYAMVTSPHGTPAQMRARGNEWRSQSVDEVVLEDLRKLQDCGLLPYWSRFDDVSTFHNATIDRAKFDAFHGSPEEDAAWLRYLKRHVPINTGSYGLLARGLYELNLRPWWRQFGSNHHAIMVLKLENMSSDASSLHKTVKAVWQHLGVPHYTIPRNGSNSHTMPKNAGTYDLLFSDATRAFLQRFYKPQNQQLRAFLLRSCGPATPQYMQTIVEQHWSEKSWAMEEDVTYSQESQ